MERTITRAAETHSADELEVDPEVDPDVVEDLRAMEANTIADRGRVLAAVVVDYDDPDTTPASVRSTVLERAGVVEDRLTATAERVLDPNPDPNTVLPAEPQGTHAIVVVELGGGGVFAERLPVPGEVPRGPGGKPPSVRRAEQFFEQYGGVETLPQLEGEHVPVTYGDGWRVHLPDDDEADLARWSSLTLLATGLLTVSVVALAVGGGVPFAGLLFLSAAALAGAVTLDWLQFGAESAGRGGHR